MRFEVVLPGDDEVEAAAERLGRVTTVEKVEGGVRAADPFGNGVLVRA